MLDDVFAHLSEAEQNRAAAANLDNWRIALAAHHMNRIEIISLEMAIAALQEKAESL